MYMSVAFLALYEQEKGAICTGCFRFQACSISTPRDRAVKGGTVNVLAWGNVLLQRRCISGTDVLMR